MRAREAGRSEASVDNYRIFERYVRAIEGRDIATMASLMHEEIEVSYPQSGEVIRGGDAYVAMLENYPGRLADAKITRVSGEKEGVHIISPMPFSIPSISISGSGSTFIGEAVGDYGDAGTFHLAVIAELRGGLVHRERWYFAEPFEAPAWRSPFVS